MQSGAHVHVPVSGSSLAAVGGLIGSCVAAKSWRWEDTVFQTGVIKTYNAHATSAVLELTE